MFDNSGKKAIATPALANRLRISAQNFSDGSNDYIDLPVDQKAVNRVIDNCIRETQQLRAGHKSGEIVCKIAAESNYPRMIEKMVCELPKWVANMREAFDRNDITELEFQTQALKEQADSAGLEDWIRKVTDVEEVLHSEEIEKLTGKPAVQ